MNAKKEFIENTEKLKIICAKIVFGYCKEEGSILLKVNHTQEDFDLFLKQLDREYYNGYGGQELDGIIWCEDDVWLTRGEYDGSEWWETNKYPHIPKELREE
jgi:hypothetical protein